MDKLIFLREKNIKMLQFDKTPMVLFICSLKKKKEKETHYTDFFLFQNLGPRTALGTAQAGAWTAGEGIRKWEMEGFLGTGHFLGLAQEWHSRQLQHKDIWLFNLMYSCNKQLEVAKFSHLQIRACSPQYQAGSFPTSFHKVVY